MPGPPARSTSEHTALSRSLWLIAVVLAALFLLAPTAFARHRGASPGGATQPHKPHAAGNGGKRRTVCHAPPARFRVKRALTSNCELGGGQAGRSRPGPVVVSPPAVTPVQATTPDFAAPRDEVGSPQTGQEAEQPEEPEVEEPEEPAEEPFPFEEEPLATFPAGHGWVGNGEGSFSDAGSPFALHNGRSFKIETDGHGDESIATSPELEPVDLTESHISFDSLVSFSAHLGQVRLRLSSGNIETDYAEAVVWQEGLDPVILGTSFESQTIPTGAFKIVGEVDWSEIDRAQIILTDNSTGPVNLYVDGIYAVRDAQRPTISFSFDDGRESTFTKGAKKLSIFHMPATAYVISGAVNEPGYMSLEQLDTLRDKDHWEIGGHAATIASHNLPNGLDSLGPEALEKEMDELGDWLDVHDFPRRTFAYPKGAASPAVRAYVERDYCAARVTARGPETIPPRNQYAMRGWSVDSAETTTADLEDAINKAVAEKSWLILTFHDLVEGQPQGPEDFNYKEFSKIVNYVHSLQVKHQVRVQTIAAAVGC
jgi:peptidoglycan/xylan/chitin deacetylase (PgdA/CDA1 family)